MLGTLAIEKPASEPLGELPHTSGSDVVAGLTLGALVS